MARFIRFFFVMLLGMISALTGIQAQNAWTAGTSASTGTFYIYNIGAQRFLNQGSSWGTHTVVDGAGAAVTISGNTNAYLLHFPKVSNASAYLSSDGWVDAGSDRDDYTTWTFEAASQSGYTNVYKLKANKSGGYLNWNGGLDNYGNEAVVGDISGKTTEALWILIPKDTREAYTNASSTNPVDMTWRLANPDFEDNTTEIVVGTAANGTDELKQTTPNQWVSDGFYMQSNNSNGTVARFVERWAGWWTVSSDIGTWPNPIGTHNEVDDIYYLTDAEIYQTLTALPEGRYRLSLTGNAEQQGDASLAVTGVQAYAGSKKVAMSGLNTYSIDFISDGNSAVKIGCTIANTNANWVYMDNLRLTYYGAVALPLPNDDTSELTPGQWYYYDAPLLGPYTLEGAVTSIVYTQNGDNLADANPDTKPAQSTLILNAGRAYFKATATGATLKIASVNAEGTTTVFTATTLNVDGLPNSILGYNLNPDGPGSNGTKLISKYLKAKNYDIIAVQEDFEYNSELLSELSGTYGYGNWRGSVSATALVSPANTDGLNFLWNIAAGRSASGESWTQFSSTASTDGNNYVKKGYRYYEVTLTDGLKIDVYMTHMDAGDNEDAIASKNAQLKQIANAIIANPHPTRPKIFMGDTNCRYTREQIVTNLINPINATGTYEMHDVWIDQERNGSYPNVGEASLSSEVVDKIFYINPTAANAATLTPELYWRETDYTYGTANGTDDNTPLGDHAPVVVRFRAHQPAIQYAAVQDRWVWKGETVSFGTENWYLYNVHFGAYDAGKQGFLTSDGTLAMDPNLSTVHPFALWGDASGASISNDYNKLRLWYSAANYKAGLISASESGATTFKVFDTNDSESNPDYALSAGVAYHFKASNHFFAADSPTSLNAHSNTSAQNAWALISKDQLKIYNRYCRAWDKANIYLTFLPLKDATKEALQTLLEKTGIDWTDGTTEQIEALNEQIEQLFIDCTALVANPSFELDADGNTLTTHDEYTNNIVPGWSVSTDNEESFISYQDKGGDGWSRYFNGVDGSYVFNTWGGTPANGYFCRQTISGLTEGFYKLTATACSDAGNTVTLKLGSNTQVTPMSGSRPSSEKLEIPLFYHSGTGDLLIEASSTTWFEIDDFRLSRFDDFVLGDVNRDGFITIADVTALVNIILGKDNVEPFLYNHAAADVNQDNSITIADVTALVNLILGKQ